MKRRSNRPLRRDRVRMRETRQGRELIVDGTFASFYKPGSAATRSVWDALAVPVLALPEQRRRRVLILGLGGGSAARVVRSLAPSAQIVGVEFDPEVVAAARRWFDLDELGVEVVLADAREFLASERRRFDVVIEDVFVGSGHAVHKPAWLPRPGHEWVARRIAPGGLLVSNALDEAASVARFLGSLFPALVRIEIEDFDNRIYAAGDRGLTAGSLRAAVAENPLLSGTLSRLSFRTLAAGNGAEATGGRGGPLGSNGPGGPRRRGPSAPRPRRARRPG